jgi:hypothetical protein
MSEWISGAFGLAGVVIGATITQGTTWWQKRKRHTAYWSAMSAEVDLCRDHSEEYVNGHAFAPLYRLPTISYDEGFPALLGDGAVSHGDAKAVLAFYGLVEQFNRGLEQVHEADVRNPGDGRVRDEAHRLDVKARHIIAPDGPYRAVRDVIDRHISTKT